MKTRTIRHTAAALGALACLAGYSVTEGEAQDGDALQAACEDAWSASQASQTCVFRFGGGIEYSASNPDRCELTRIYCRVSVGKWHHNYSWWGSHDEIRGLANCNGILRPGPC